MTMNSTRKGFAYHLGNGLGIVVAGVLSLERRALVGVSCFGKPALFVGRALFLTMKLAAVAAVLVALLPAISWLVSFILGFVFLAGMVYLVANPDRDGLDALSGMVKEVTPAPRNGFDGYGYYVGNYRVDGDDD
ncbi:conserved membrane hypothetical protein [Pseudomonas sp. 8Z]|uniref:DUF3742 family protein n=1 Tax=Pseudomonas sp. 8Z TaxID=2653166 RepID=UPI0012F17919|nr:DUF3742 family protein [Pseudomonas sp. 8Z]VXC22553.1 conserved membrane hypothetical protein [Pseudomonas sp. 8Z]